MMNFKDISWQVDEPTYRNDPALSYSTIARFSREGFNKLDKLFERIETPSLTFGSAVDSIITGGEKEFNDRFFVADFPIIPDSVILIIKDLFNEFGITHKKLSDIPDVEIIGFAEKYNYHSNWKPETRAKVIKETGEQYYQILYVAGNKTILDTKTNSDIRNCVRVLKSFDTTKFYFEDNNPFDKSIERFYQLKFKATINNIDFRSMADLIVVDHNTKEVTPVDLKTTGHPEWDFYKSFVEWRYDIQARLYWNLIRENMNNSDYKDYTLNNYRFIVVNRTTLTPLVWEFSDTQSKETLYYGKNHQIELKSPIEIAEELNYYLKSNCVVPIGIEKINSIENWLSKL